MDYNNIGKVIHVLRNHKGISRLELCNGICSEKQLYRIENLQSIPTIYLVQQLSYRLGANLTDYLIFSFCDDPVYVTHQVKTIEYYYLNRQFINVINCIQKFDKYYYKHLEVKQLLTWYEIIAMSNEGKLTLSQNILFDLLKLSTSKSLVTLCNGYLTDNELRIVHSIISLYCKNKEFGVAKNLLISLTKNLTNSYFSKNNSIYLQLLYNLSKLYYIENNYSNSIYTANLGISFCRKNNFLSILPDFFIFPGSVMKQTEIFQKLLNVLRTLSFYMRYRVTTNIQKNARTI
jgi:transcriptional regulator with XRE-family HTH domain